MIIIHATIMTCLLSYSHRKVDRVECHDEDFFSKLWAFWFIERRRNDFSTEPFLFKLSTVFDCVAAKVSRPHLFTQEDQSTSSAIIEIKSNGILQNALQWRQTEAMRLQNYSAAFSNVFKNNFFKSFLWTIDPNQSLKQRPKYFVGKGQVFDFLLSMNKIMFSCWIIET